jgi:predicted RNase H-like nuclease (RuvC/YqgF family)
MGKDSTQKAARQRRRVRQRQLVEAGRQSVDLVSQCKHQVEEAVARAGRLGAEVAKARQDLGEATSLLAEANKALGANATILDGLRQELDLAAQQVKMAEAERDAMSRDLAAARRELEIMKAADIDAKSLRARLQHKSGEIEELKAKLREAQEVRRQASPGLVFDRSKKAGDGVDGAPGSSSE